MTIAYVLVQCTIGHEMDVLRNLLNLDLNSGFIPSEE